MFQTSKGQQEPDSEQTNTKTKQTTQNKKQTTQTKYKNVKDLVQQGETGVAVQVGSAYIPRSSRD